MTKADDHPQEMPQEMEFVGYDRRFAPMHRASIDLHVQIAVLAREMQGENRPHYEPVAEEFVRLAPTYIDNVAHAGALLFVGRAGWRSVSQPGTTGFGFEQLHMDLEEGPAIDAADGRQVVRVTDLTVETRWPRFRDAAASKTAVRSMICYPLYTRIHTWGALMLFADQPAVLDGDSQQSGEIPGHSYGADAGGGASRPPLPVGAGQPGHHRPGKGHVDRALRRRGRCVRFAHAVGGGIAPAGGRRCQRAAGNEVPQHALALRPPGARPARRRAHRDR
jgi:hypothetical protein